MATWRDGTSTARTVSRLEDPGAPLSAAEVQDAAALIATIQGNGVAKIARVKAIEDILILAESRPPGYSTTAEVQAKLGV